MKHELDRYDDINDIRHMLDECDQHGEISTDRIRPLLDELAALRERGRWRKWPDEAPDWSRDTFNPPGRREVCVLRGYENGDVSPRWVHEDSSRTTVFHWLPLPEAPR